MKFDTTNQKPVKLGWEAMREGIDGQPRLFETAPATLLEQAAAAIGDTAPSSLVFVGAGDSLFAAEALTFALQKLTGIRVEAIESMEFSRYHVEYLPTGTLVVAISNSGEVARTVEAIRFARHAGHRTLGVTYNLESRLAAESELVLSYDYRDVGFGPGTMSYVSSMLAVYAIGMHIARLLGRLDEDGAAAELSSLADLGPILSETIRLSDAPAAAVAAALSPGTGYFIIGAGPNLATAHFSMAKIIEAARFNAVAQQLEEWAHEHYFLCGPGTVTTVLAPAGRSLERARDVLGAIRGIGGTSVVVCEVGDTETAALADHVLPVAGKVDEALSPFVYLASAELIGYHLGSSRGGVMFGFDDPKRKEINFQQIYRSRIPDSIKEAAR